MRWCLGKKVGNKAKKGYNYNILPTWYFHRKINKFLKQNVKHKLLLLVFSHNPD